MADVAELTRKMTLTEEEAKVVTEAYEEAIRALQKLGSHYAPMVSLIEADLRMITRVQW